MYMPVDPEHRFADAADEVYQLVISIPDDDFLIFVATVTYCTLYTFGLSDLL
jgi:hypothetical protein